MFFDQLYQHLKQSPIRPIALAAGLVLACGLLVFIASRGFSPSPSQKEVIIQAPSSQPTSTPATSPAPPLPPQEPTGPFEETLTIAEGDTLAEVLGNLGIPCNQAQEVITALSTAFNPKDLKVDQEIYVVYNCGPGSEECDLQSLYIRPDIDHDVEVLRTKDGAFEATKHKIQLKHTHVDISGSIDMSLYVDALRAGASPKMLEEMIKIFSYDVDFQRDIQPGTEFSLLYDTYKDEESGLERPGELLYAHLVLEGKPYALYRFQPPGGVPGYYTLKGESVKKALLKTPVDGARLTSGFGNRKHPIQGYTKMHKGVDFGAPKGTPIMAAGDGIVERCNKFGGYGNYICIKHGGNTKTAYAHLCRFAKGMKAGKKVKQGSIIGYVGSTGNSTGPHLHFEVIQNGKHVNPQKITQFPSSKLGGKALAAFKAQVTKVEKMRKENERKRKMAMNTLH
jgi:murein DD-endopeptidase MepM/ murein hydrolase activator NlpD